MDFRKKVNSICRERGMTQKQLAQEMGILPVNLNKMLRGEYPRLQTLEKIARILDIPLSHLFEENKYESEFVCPECGAKLAVMVKK